MATKFSFKVEHFSIFEWTATLDLFTPQQYQWMFLVGDRRTDILRSPTFTFQGCECCLLLDFSVSHEDFRLHIACEQKPLLPFDATVSIVNGTDTTPYPRRTVNDPSATIWECGYPQIFKLVKPFNTQYCLNFKVILHDTSSDWPVNAGDEFASNNPCFDERFHLHALSRDFEKLFCGGPNHDVELTCGNRTFMAHREILSTRSEVFAAMLQSDMIEGKTGLVKIWDVEADIFQQFLRYIYTGRLPEMTVDTAEQFYEAGDKYAVEELKEASYRYLIKNLTLDNACAILNLADRHSDEDFRESVILYILSEKVPLRYDKWTDFCDGHPKLAIEVLNRFCKEPCSTVT